MKKIKKTFGLIIVGLIVALALGYINMGDITGAAEKVSDYIQDFVEENPELLEELKNQGEDLIENSKDYITEYIEENPEIFDNLKEAGGQLWEAGKEAFLQQMTGNTGVSDLDTIPEYRGYAAVEVNGNEPYFTDAEKQRTDAFEEYSDLDYLGRCGVAYANICVELMPTEERGSIGSITPSGWKNVKYNDYIEGNYLYNRCHLIGFQLAGENANKKNLITGTRYMNCDGQLPFENMVADYVQETGNHVLYRVTPIYEGNNLVASGVLTEAWSVEDNGEGICFNVFCFNVQPGIEIDYTDGSSKMLEGYTGEYAVKTYYSSKKVEVYEWYNK